MEDKKMHDTIITIYFRHILSKLEQEKIALIWDLHPGFQVDPGKTVAW